jgi:hypothetical protein
MAISFGKRSFIALLLCGAVLLVPSRPRAEGITADIHVKLRPVLERIDLVTDINAIGDTLYVCTQPGLLLTKNLGTPGTTTYSVVLDLRTKVGRLGSRIPALPGLGYPVPETYDERGLLGFAADPNFRHNGRFWVWYTAIEEHSPNPPGFFQWLVSTSAPWNQAEYDHVGHVEEYQWVGGVAEFRRTLLNVKRPYFNHTGFQSLHWSPEFGTLVLALGDGGSEYDPNNIAQDDRQLSGKLLKIDLDKLRGRDFTGSAPVATFADLAAQGVPSGAFTPLVKGLRNPSKVHYLRTRDGDDDREREGDERRFIKILANTGQDTIEFIHAFRHYGVNFGFRPWEGIFPTSFEIDDTRVIAYGLEASRLPNFYRPFVEYTHLDPVLAPNANTGSAIYHGSRFPGLNGQVVFTDWITFARTPKQGLLMHAPIDRDSLQEVQTIHLFDVDLSEAGLKAGQPIFYTSINTNERGDRVFIGGFKDIQFIVNQRNNPPGGSELAGGLYEVVPE